ncbi:unnamed protein product [Rodentolepis nana]|uniref:Retrovirus-related Pol polyprotein from transposon TNT 1-94 n=1 Tax=Rodentolepis nana TaxID=102285 RepID=A0A0R3TU49_RODNA|nr:unnamed protein product [Rodentolepis nana]
MMRCANKTIPLSKTKHYRVFWSKHLEELKRKWKTLCNIVDQTEITESCKAGDDSRLSKFLLFLLYVGRITLSAHLNGRGKVVVERWWNESSQATPVKEVIKDIEAVEFA